MPATHPPNFDRVAHLYRWSEYLTLGPLLERTRFHWIPRLADRRSALVLGDGDGRFLARLLAQHPQLRATAIDTSAAMLRLLRARCAPQAADRLETLRASALDEATLDHVTSRSIDLLVTHFVLDCFTQSDVDRLAQRLAARVAPGCLWLVSDFAVPRNPLLRPLAAAYLRALYLAFRVLTGLRVTHLPDHAAALAAAGFIRIERTSWCAGLLFSEIWQRDRTREQTPPAGRDDKMLSGGTAMELEPNPATDRFETTRHTPHLAADALPDPEPAAPSLPGPDPALFHPNTSPIPSTPESTER